MSRLCIYFKEESPVDRWFPGDRLFRPLLRRIIKGKSRRDGVDKTFINLCLGLDQLNVPYHINLPYAELHPHDHVAVFGRGKTCLEGFKRSIPIVAGVGLMDHPSNWPDLCQKYPIKTLLQPSRWAADIYRKAFTPTPIGLWATGIQTDLWRPQPEVEKDIDVLIYDKIRWGRDEQAEHPRASFMEELVRSRDLISHTIRYGDYTPEDYLSLLSRSRSMAFLCEHESQGLAYQEALSCDVPVFAWNHGSYLNPAYLQPSTPPIPATSVPYFDFRCGLTFQGLEDIEDTFDEFWGTLITSGYTPREYILENLSLERCAGEFLNFFNI